MSSTAMGNGVGFVSSPPRNPLAGPNRRVNAPKIERDRTKYRRKKKHKN